MLWARWGSAAFERLAWTGAGQPPAAGPVPVQLQAAQVARIPMAGLWTARIQALAARTAAVQPPQGLDCRSSRKRRKTEKIGEKRRKTEKKRRKTEKNGEKRLKQSSWPASGPLPARRPAPASRPVRGQLGASQPAHGQHDAAAPHLGMLPWH